MKKIIVIVFVLVAFVANFATALTADSTKTTKKVQELSKKEYTLIAGTDTTLAKPGDTIAVTFTPDDSLKATGKTTVQMIGGVETKVKQVTANGKKFWIKDDVDLSDAANSDVIIEMLCDEDESGDPIAPGWYGLMSLVAIAGVFGLWKVFRR